MEVREYLRLRAEGVSRRIASQVFGSHLHEEYARWLDRKLAVIVTQGKALWPDRGDPHSHGVAWISSLLGGSEDPVVALNHYALSNRVNCLWFSRRPGVDVRRPRAGTSGFT